MNISPGSTKYWTPDCEQSKKAYVGQRFSTLEAGITFYTAYVTITGFDVRRATEKKDRQGKITWKYVLCSRAGFKIPTGGATITDFGNFKRDIMAYIEGADAQLVIDAYMAKKNICTDYYFAHDVDELDQLCRIFWADSQAQQNYKLFGDIMSFDATYNTNRYKLVFVPFTGVDHHKKSVTFAAGLIAREDVDSYCWLLEQFKNAMGNVPACTVTDQDPAMKVAVARVFYTTQHRFCMWHIMTKVSEKAGQTLVKSEDFLKDLNNVVWDETQTTREFEEAWQTVMEKHDLVEHQWFKHMFEIHEHWIPAYFNNVFMGGLIRTTSRSESVNSVFSNCTSPYLSLTKFFVRFEKAIDKQRHTQAQLNTNCEGKFPELKTPLAFEKQAATTYTTAVFYDVQKEILEGCFSSQVLNEIGNGCTRTFVIEDRTKSKYTVDYNSAMGTVQCTCKMFHRIGLLCRHVFLAFKDVHLERIPGQYILARWSRKTSSPHAWLLADTELENPTEAVGGNSRMATIFDEFFKCVGVASRNNDRITELAQVLHQHRENCMRTLPQEQPTAAKSDLIRSLCGSTSSTTIEVQPPAISKNKGSRKRLKSAKEIASEQAAKGKRKCRTCLK
ncbi:protein FAR1-RELATED SEQUENCE 5-like [Ipomoea triloba]|uniref:protein FAR1-RELATED SEQUENCE 5-like n=1 Tax=Ipomoea triloba TaxID=35885 RepID=UPI00125D4958|nr:protein FAR1-RELATED SEQUENCE 5-like [Ipomoea triloba]